MVFFSMLKRFKRVLIWILLIVVVLVASGWILADQLMPAAVGEPGHTLPVQADATALDRELIPMLDRHPGQSGVILIDDGLEAFAARAMTARQAGRSLDLQYYIWHDDLPGRLLAYEVWQAAERGVRVRMLLDDINSSGKDKELMAMDSHPNIEVRIYNPFRNRGGVFRVIEMIQRGLSLNHRMHNKAWIADNRAAVVGGRNIGAEYFSASEDSNFRDLDAIVFGPVVNEASTIFDSFWNSRAVVPISALNKGKRVDLNDLLQRASQDMQRDTAVKYLERVAASRKVQAYLSQSLAPHWTDQVKLLSDPPLKWKNESRQQWLVNVLNQQLHSAQQHVLLISPYFVPGEAYTQGMVDSVKQGRDVRVITNSLAANDVVAVHGGYRKYRKPLLEGGVKIYELRASNDASAENSFFGSSGASLHTKAFLVDQQHGFIGSFNLDPRSAHVNTEMGLFFNHKGIANDLNKEYELLASADTSYRVFLNEEGKLRWEDASVSPTIVYDQEPKSTFIQRASAIVISWLPIESQL